MRLYQYRSRQTVTPNSTVVQCMSVWLLAEIKMGSLLQLVSLYLCKSTLLMLCLPGAVHTRVSPSSTSSDLLGLHTTVLVPSPTTGLSAEAGSGGDDEAITPSSTLPATSPVINGTGSPTTPNGACSTTTASPDAIASNLMDFTCSLHSNVKGTQMYSIIIIIHNHIILCFCTLHSLPVHLW